MWKDFYIVIIYFVKRKTEHDFFILYIRVNCERMWHFLLLNTP